MTNKMERVDLMMHKETIKKLDKLAESELETRSNIIRRIVNKHLNELAEVS